MPWVMAHTSEESRTLTFRGGETTTSRISRQRLDSAFAQFVQRPAILAHELVNHAPVLQFWRHHFPRVRFHLHVGAHPGFALPDIKQSEQVVRSVVKQRGGLAVEWNMKMNAPLR